MFKKKNKKKGGKKQQRGADSGSGGGVPASAASLSASSSSSHSANSSQSASSVGRPIGRAGRSSSSTPRHVRQRQPDIQSLVPRYLKPCLTHYYGDFFATAQTDPVLFAQVMVEGFLPIASKTNYDDDNGMTIVLPKLHRERCVISPISDMHISRSVRKKSKRYVCTINRNFDGVVAGCHRQHGQNWLYPEVVAAFRSMHSRGTRGMETMLFEDDSPVPVGVCPVRLYSIEICNESSGQLVAGELGYTVGSIYTSLTGFTAEDGAGSVQLAVLGTLLQKCQFDMWDMGMTMDYKESLGAHLMPRAEFVYSVRRVRVERPNVLLSLERPTMNCKEVLTGTSPMDADVNEGKSNHEHGRKKDKKETKKHHQQHYGKKHEHTHGPADSSANEPSEEEEEGHKRRKKKESMTTEESLEDGTSA
mmetsp:Transcript_6725/g.14698  ORF Transcript_6725/g.14698 Transcript_6725/m.14698 type:complete len:419 (+) Transcript_6725:36-1292(+)